MMGGSDDVPGVLANMGLGRGPRWQLFATAASAVSVVNSIVGGSAVTILLGVTLDLPLAVAAIAGGSFVVASVVLHQRYDRRHHVQAGGHLDVLFPSPPGS
jgi:hypothetical protein